MSAISSLVCQKPKTPFLAEVVPVAKHGQAGTVTGGKVDISSPLAPSLIIISMLGSLPSPTHISTSLGSAASKPMTKTFLTLCWPSLASVENTVTY